MYSNESALVIGGARFIGSAVVRQLLRQGYKVTVFNRGNIASEYPAGVLFVRGDRRNGFSFGETFDVVIDMCAYRGEDTERAFRDIDFRFFIHMGTAAAYRRSDVFPLHEGSPLGNWPVWGAYNQGKVECEEVLAKSDRPHAVVRPVSVLGPENHLNRESFIYQKIKHGEPLVLPGDGSALAQYVFAEEVADTVLRIAETKTEGAVNCAGDDAITLVGLVREMADIAGRKAIICFNPETDKEHHDLAEFPFPNEHFMVSNERAKSLGVKFRPLREGLRRDYEDYYIKAI